MQGSSSSLSGPSSSHLLSRGFKSLTIIRLCQVLVNSLLLKVNPETSEPSLATGSWMRSLAEDTRVQIVGHIKRRWMQIREKSGFQDLEGWALKEIADGELLFVSRPEHYFADLYFYSLHPRHRSTHQRALGSSRQRLQEPIAEASGLVEFDGQAPNPRQRLAQVDDAPKWSCRTIWQAQGLGHRQRLE